VFVTKVEPNYSQPWQMCPQRSSTGSAFVIDCAKRLVLTNSHVISNATAVYLRRPGVAKKYKAEVLADAKVRRNRQLIFDTPAGRPFSPRDLGEGPWRYKFPGLTACDDIFLTTSRCIEPVLGFMCVLQVCDLALLTVTDDSFWDQSDMRALEFVDVPELQVVWGMGLRPEVGCSYYSFQTCKPDTRRLICWKAQSLPSNRLQIDFVPLPNFREGFSAELFIDLFPLHP